MRLFEVRRPTLIVSSAKPWPEILDHMKSREGAEYSMHCSLLPGCRCNGTGHFLLLPPWLPHHYEQSPGTLSENIPFFPNISCQILLSQQHTRNYYTPEGVGRASKGGRATLLKDDPVSETKWQHTENSEKRSILCGWCEGQPVWGTRWGVAALRELLRGCHGNLTASKQ